MHTYYLSHDEVTRYATDFCERVLALGADIPKTWVFLGQSGDAIGKIIYPLLPTATRNLVNVLRVSYDRPAKNLVVRGGGGWPALSGAPVLLIDSAIHSGSSMNIAAETMSNLGARDILSYSLVVKKTSDFIPTFFGVVIGEHDRAFFLLKTFPNNRLRRRLPIGSLRSVRQDDISKLPPTITSGVPSIDKITFGDYIFQVRVQGARVYVYELDKKIVGVLNIHIDQHATLHIDVVAVDVSCHGQDMGGMLMRWADTYARASNCLFVELWAHASRLTFYQNFDFSLLQADPVDIGGGEVSHQMRKKLLYNIKVADM